MRVSDNDAIAKRRKILDLSYLAACRRPQSLGLSIAVKVKWMERKLIIRMEGRSIIVKIGRVLAALIVVGLFGSSCATLSRLNAEYEEQMTREAARVAAMTPQARAEWEKAEQDRQKINWNEYLNGDND